MHPFRAAVEAHSLESIADLLAEDVVFLSPVAFAPYHGRPLVSAILRHVAGVLQDFTYVREIGSGGEDGLALIFKANVDGREVHGCDFLTFNDDGLISEFCVMVRPLSGARALADAMAKEFEAIKRELGLAD